jgi:IS5 family transposase
MAGRGRHPYPLETMLRVHLMQNWFGLSDPAMEEALYEITPMRAFAGLTLTKAIPDETTILNFRHLLEANELAPEILSRVNAYLSRKGLMLKRGSIVDATIIAAPSSTKNAEGERDPEMHQTKKGNQWHFGMKAHIGVDADSGLVHTVTTTPANAADVEVVDELLHGKEAVVHADSGYTGADKRVRRKKLTWRIAAKRGRIKAMADGREKRALERIEKAKASVRAKVEHPFRVIKRQFGLMKVRFRGLAKNTAHVITLFALSNLWMTRRRLLAMTG